MSCNSILLWLPTPVSESKSHIFPNFRGSLKYCRPRDVQLPTPKASPPPLETKKAKSCASSNSERLFCLHTVSCLLPKRLIHTSSTGFHAFWHYLLHTLNWIVTYIELKYDITCYIHWTELCGVSIANKFLTTQAVYMHLPQTHQWFY